MKALGISLAVALLAGCASTTPRELVDARAAYTHAQQSPDAKYAPAEMREAQVALQNAEGQFDKHGDEPETRDAAYVASRQAIAAQAKGEAVRTLEEKRNLEASLARFKDAQLAQLGQTRDALNRSQDAVQSERSARVAAEQKANDALTAIQGLKTSQDERGLVVTLTGSVLFQTNQSKLMPAAQQRLTEVANALKEDKRPITIVGHADSTGSDETNQRLSQERAESVRAFLTQHGVPADRVTAMGMGESQPVADNSSPEGRANNRRVEIILQRSGGNGGNGRSGGGGQTR